MRLLREKISDCYYDALKDLFIRESRVKFPLVAGPMFHTYHVHYYFAPEGITGTSLGLFFRIKEEYRNIGVEEARVIFHYNNFSEEFDIQGNIEPVALQLRAYIASRNLDV